jgi:hypothetical protein
MNPKVRFPAHLGRGVSIIATHGAPDLSPASVSHQAREGVRLLLSSAVRDAVVAQQLRAVLASSSQGHLQIFRLDNREVIRHSVDLVVRGESRNEGRRQQKSESPLSWLSAPRIP